MPKLFFPRRPQHFFFFVMVSMPPSARSFAPSFDRFLNLAKGDWKGAKYYWSTDPSDEDRGFFPVSGVGPETWFMSPPEPASSSVEEVMRSCGGAVQSVKELREDGGEVCFNRADDGFTFFDDGSFVHGPVEVFSEEGLDQFGAPSNTFGLTVCLAHGDKETLVRRRLLLAIVDGKLCGADVAFEGRGGEKQPPEATSVDLLNGRIKVVADASAWEGGARAEILTAKAPPGSPWIAPRVKWVQRTQGIEGGTALLPSSDEPSPGKTADVNFLPGGCWVSIEAEDETFAISIGSLDNQEDSLHAGELKCITRRYIGGCLQMVEQQSICSQG